MSELFLQLQRLSSLQSLVRCLEAELGPPPEDEASGYISVAKMLLASFEKADAALVHLRDEHHHSSATHLDELSADHPRYPNYLRAAFGLVLNKKVSDEAPLTIEQQLPLLAHSRSAEGEDDNDDDDEDALLPSNVEEAVFDILYKRLKRANLREAITKGAQTMANNIVAELAAAKMEREERARIERRLRATAFEKELNMRSTASAAATTSSAGGGGASAAGGGGGDNGLPSVYGAIGIDLTAADDDDDDGTGGGTSSSAPIEIERCDREPSFLRSMGVNFRQRLYQQEQERRRMHIQEQRLKSAGVTKSMTSSGSAYIPPQLSGRGGAEQTNKTSMELALERREQHARELREIDRRANRHATVQKASGGSGASTLGASAYTRELGESVDAENGSSMIPPWVAQHQQRHHQYHGQQQQQQQQQQRHPYNQQQQQYGGFQNSNNNSYNPQQRKMDDGGTTMTMVPDAQTEEQALRFAAIQKQRASLPIASHKDEIIEVISSQRVTVLVGETGSGKTTQLPQYLLEAGFGGERHFQQQGGDNDNNGNDNSSSSSSTAAGTKPAAAAAPPSSRKKPLLIACTQPRLIAAKTIAERVAEEQGCKLGDRVGYTVRFDDMTSPATRLKYMTDGVLLREALLDDSFSRYSVIILDEAHERNLNTDILFSLCKKAILKNPNLTLVVTSATLDVERFCEYFGCKRRLEIPGRTVPVDRVFLKDPCDDYFEEAMLTIMKIHVKEPPGDILVFLTGRDEIENARKRLERWLETVTQESDEFKHMPPLVITRLYAGLQEDEKAKALMRTPEFSRKVVLSTNIAETSVTIDGLYYVIDCGFCKENIYNPKTGVDRLAVVPVAQSQAKQRCGRAGRTGPGKCFFLYTEAQFFRELKQAATPEIQRTNLANVVLTLKAIGVNDLLSLEFMDPPPKDALVNAMEHLYFLSALDEFGVLTRLGSRMSQLPVSPNESKTLLTAYDFGCLDQVLTIVAMLGEQHIFHRVAREQKDDADRARQSFTAAEGDHITLLRVYEAWEEAEFDKGWCRLQFVNPAALQRCRDLRNQLQSILRMRESLFKNKHHQQQQPQGGFGGGEGAENDSGSGGDSALMMAMMAASSASSSARDLVAVRKSLVAGYFYHAAKRSTGSDYVSLADKRSVSLHPSSVLYHTQPKYIIYHELVETTKEYMREAVSVDPAWLLEMAPSFFSTPGLGKKSREQQTARLDPILRSWETHGGKNTWRISKLREPRR